MLKRITIPALLIALLMGSLAQAQVKIGDNPQVIDPSSILELESSERVLVITRVDSVQMTQIVPNRGAMVYNTTADCVFYYDGTRWVNLCGAGGNPITADPIVNDISTIVITPTENGDNLEIAPNSIQSEQIVNGGVNGIDIQNNSIGPNKLQDNSVTQEKLSENSVGAFALDNDNIDLSDFNNSTGFIRSADVISGDANNAISAGGDGGAFYDDTGILAQIDANSSAIAADGDTDSSNEIQNLNLSGNLLTISSGNTVTLPSADGSDTNINAGANITITGNGTAATPYVIAAVDEVDGSITNELTDLNFDTGTNILSLTNGATVAGSSVDLSTLAGGAGTTELADGTTILGTGTPTDRFRIAPSPTNGQFLSTDASGNVAWANL
ncbi:MAG: hypothetical protein HKN31_00030, partial [Pricia sp.]|nr:hypothetical protein [Pricia sp.]